VGILKSKMISWRLPNLVIIVSLLLYCIIMHDVIIIFLINTSSRNAIRNKMWQ